jgi:hypothetical protein
MSVSAGGGTVHQEASLSWLNRRDTALPRPQGGANLFYLRGEKVTKLVVYNDATRAVADLGLPLR